MNGGRELHGGGVVREDGVGIAMLESVSFRIVPTFTPAPFLPFWFWCLCSSKVLVCSVTRNGPRMTSSFAYVP